MIPDEHQAENPRGDAEFAELVGRIGNVHMRFKLSAPFNLRDAVKHWTGLSQDEGADVIEQHLPDYRRLYVSGSFFHMVHQAIGKALDAKHRNVRFGDKPERRRRARRRVMKVYSSSGVADVFVDDPSADRLLPGRQTRNPGE
jgi:hypothetical protein